MIRSRSWAPSCAILVLLALLLPLTAQAAATATWPEFRGPWANGHVAPPGDSEPTGLPLEWSESANITWKTPIPHQGWSTPVILDGQIWLTTATPDGHDFYALCIDAATGEIRVNKHLFHSDDPEPLGNDVNCYASPSPVIEPGRVYVHFGSYGTACLNTADGEVLWQRTDLPCRHYRGPGSSPIIFEDLLILTFDGVDVQYVTALNKNTGESVWRTDRTTEWTDLDSEGQPLREGDFRKAFSTPIIIDVNGQLQLISPGSYAAYAYDVRTGKEIWKTHNDCYTPASRPVFGNGLVYLTKGRGDNAIWAVRPDGQGDVTDTHVAWKTEGHQAPEEPSPVLAGDLFFMVSNRGQLTCLEAATGVEVWSERIGGGYMASPIYADGRLYIPSVQGKTIVAKAGRTFEVLATNELDEGCLASPAVSGNALFLRTKTHLYRIESKAGEAK